jgi:hypothetical protein
MIRRLSLAAIVVGIVSQIAGLAVDSILHARNASLAESEGVLSLSNPGHLLFAGGLALAMLGAGTLLTAPLLARRRPGIRGLALASVPAAVLLALSGGSFAIAAQNGGLSGGHHHDSAAHTHGDSPASLITAEALAHSHDSAAAPAQAGDLSRHDHGAEVNVSWEQLRDINAILDTARAATEKYQDVAVARRDGYIQVTQVIPGLGAHFVNAALMASGTFDPAHPAILLYDRAPDGGFELVGVSWTSPKRAGVDTPPPSVFGQLGTWHYHTNLCFGLAGGAPSVSANTAAACRASGGAFLRETPWMIHAWLFRPSPEGVFSHENSSITGTPTTITAARP